ncbi:chloroplast envelope membrane protein isoform X2 [Ricinus communis]|uniref:chloroplast envelope membrane protein isoform X2 n=1 Tax=Ricinus communis TaxID=3988 RepID=UPI0007724B21|nr:chloroplast envelope membrane protein isoform X2 [Ricinus communis]|eukprot:XP_015581610.1 chloroplast envelope membrane protein isoform X2 [Ricinus communis]
MLFLMSTSMVLPSLVFIDQNPYRNSISSSTSTCSNFLIQFSRRRGFCELVPNAKKKKKKNRKRSWWQRFFFDDDGNWLGLKDDDMLETETEFSESSSSVEILSEEEKFEAWKRRAEAIVELREAQEDMLNEESRRWEDWIVDDSHNNNVNGSWWSQDLDGGGNGAIGGSADDVGSDPSDLVPEKGFVESVRDLVLGGEEEDLLYEDRIFQYASLNSAKFLAVLILIPWALDFAVHDYVLMPFLDRYVKTVPLAAQMLDVRKDQKLEMVKELKTEQARLRLEVEIGKSPPLSDEEVWWELRHKALELRDEWRLENRRAFANIWSDMIFGISLFVLLYFNQNKVALLKFTGYKIVNNVSDTGKAFLIILITDIFLGYHSESGWQTLLEILVEHYGLDIDKAAITIFICLVPVVIDACVKLWLFKFLPRLSPKVANIFREMKRH